MTVRDIFHDLFLDITLLKCKEIFLTKKLTGVSYWWDKVLVFLEEILDIICVNFGLTVQQSTKLLEGSINKPSTVGKPYEPVLAAYECVVVIGYSKSWKIVPVLNELGSYCFIWYITALEFNIDDLIVCDAKEIEFFSELLHRIRIIECQRAGITAHRLQPLGKKSEPFCFPFADPDIHSTAWHLPFNLRYQLGIV